MASTQPSPVVVRKRASHSTSSWVKPYCRRSRLSSERSRPGLNRTASLSAAFQKARLSLAVDSLVSPVAASVARSSA